MTTKSPEDDEFCVDEPSLSSPGEGLAEDSEHRIDNWDVPRDAEPCTVYRDSPDALGRVTTPLGDLSFTNLFGAPVAMMRQFGRRSAADIREGALDFLDQFTVDVVDAAAPGFLSALAGKWALNHWALKRLRNAVPADYLKVLRAYGEGSGYDVDDVVSAQLAWDIWAIMACIPVRRMQSAAGRARRHSPLLGSCSLVLPSESVGPLHLRWFDNTAVERWDRKTSATFFHPDQGLPYVLVSSIGFVTGLPAGMNGAGLTVTVEPGLVGGIDWQGIPLGQAVHDVLSQAHTIEEAAAILRQNPALTPWRYVICEGDTGRATVFEAGRDVEEWARAESPPFAVASADVRLPGQRLDRVARWHKGRRKALDEIVENWSETGQDAVYDALQAMTSPIDAVDTISGHPLSGLSNVAAVVFEPASRRLWVAAGKAPVSRRWFVPMSLRPLDGSGGGGLDGRVRPLKPGNDWDSTTEGRAVEHLRHAYQLDLSGEKSERILITLEHALALDSGRPSFHILAGLMALRVGRGRRAEGAFQKALGLVEEPTRQAEVFVYKAWALDLQGRRREAKKIYQRLSKDPAIEAAARRWARHGRRHRFRENDVQNLNIDFFLATVFEA